jgi:hypothetical protein
VAPRCRLLGKLGQALTTLLRCLAHHVGPHHQSSVILTRLTACSPSQMSAAAAATHQHHGVDCAHSYLRSPGPPRCHPFLAQSLARRRLPPVGCRRCVRDRPGPRAGGESTQTEQMSSAHPGRYCIAEVSVTQACSCAVRACVRACVSLHVWAGGRISAC